MVVVLVLVWPAPRLSTRLAGTAAAKPRALVAGIQSVKNMGAYNGSQARGLQGHSCTYGASSHCGGWTQSSRTMERARTRMKVRCFRVLAKRALFAAHEAFATTSRDGATSNVGTFRGEPCGSEPGLSVRARCVRCKEQHCAYYLISTVECLECNERGSERSSGGAAVGSALAGQPQLSSGRWNAIMTSGITEAGRPIRRSCWHSILSQRTVWSNAGHGRLDNVRYGKVKWAG